LVKESTRIEVERWWRALFDVDDDLWSRVTVVHPHTELDDYAGWIVAWRDAGVHISAPWDADVHDVEWLANQSTITLQDAYFWQSFARRRGFELVGPGVHRYLDIDPGVAEDVVEVEPSTLLPLRNSVSDEDWWESGFDEAIFEPGVVAFATEGGAAVLRELDGAPRNVALLVAADARGRGIGTAVGRAASAYAVRRHGYARWRCRDSNVPSARAAERLGFEPYATQLAVRPVRSGS
jgi:GNAT superfamily N-acetyltransferase